MFSLLRRSSAYAVALLLLGLSPTLQAQEEKAETKDDAPAASRPAITLGVGDAAPALKVEKFLKGEPVKEFKAGNIYVVEFWATWCGPCRFAMPHMTELQKKLKDKVTFISVNVWEDPEYKAETFAKVEDFVKKNDERMGYTVAFDGAAKATDKAYMQAAGQNGIPTAFIVTGDGKIGYIGHPMDEAFEGTLQKLIDGKFDMAAAIAANKEERAKMEAEAQLQRKAEALGNAADELLQQEKYAEADAKFAELAKLVPQMGDSIEMHKFDVLLQKEKYEKAYEQAERLINGPAKESAGFLNAIAWRIVDPEAKVAKPNTDIAIRAAELAMKLTEDKEPGIIDTLARCYWVKGDKARAIELQTKAVELAKDNEEHQADLQKTLDEYKQGAK